MNGDGIKISLGGHEYTKEQKLMKNAGFKDKFVNFEETSFAGDMGFFENNELKCWSKN